MVAKVNFVPLACALALLSAGPAPAQAPAAAVDRVALCWAALTHTYMLARGRETPPPAARDSFEERLRETTGYYNGLIGARYPSDAELAGAMREGMAAFNRGNREQITRECLAAYGQQLLRFSRLVREIPD
jgi:hypothetical protein